MNVSRQAQFQRVHAQTVGQPAGAVLADAEQFTAAGQGAVRIVEDLIALENAAGAHGSQGEDAGAQFVRPGHKKLDFGFQSIHCRAPDFGQLLRRNR